MRFIELFGKHGKGKIAFIDDEDYEKVTEFIWSVNAQGYACHATWEDSKVKVTQMHNLIMGVKDGFVVDHINRDILDNRRSNLRHVTRAQNTRNSRLNQNNKSGYRGVHEVRGRWVAMIRVNRQRSYLGIYDTAEEAARAYDEAVLKLQDRHAYRNFPELTNYKR